MYRINQFEEEAWHHNRLICGIDEVGRGSLAGPLVAAAALLPLGTTHPLLKDSKIMTAAQRERAYAWILEHAWFGVGIVPHRCIDDLGIVQATRVAMKKSLLQLLLASPYRPSTVVVDAMPLCLQDLGITDMNCFHFPKGEAISISIAAASIIAKVTRDRLMQRLHAWFPAYQFDLHKGYGTAKHLHALEAHGISIIHRRSFLKHYYATHQGQQQEQQLSCIKTTENKT